MSAQIAAYGRLGRDPRPVDTSSGKAMTVASVAVTVESRESGETGEGTLWFDVVSFGRVADDLARHAKGDLVSVAGRMQLSRFTSSTSGEVRESWQVVADALVSEQVPAHHDGIDRSRPRSRRGNGAAPGHEASVLRLDVGRADPLVPHLHRLLIGGDRCGRLPIMGGRSFEHGQS